MNKYTKAITLAITFLLISSLMVAIPSMAETLDCDDILSVYGGSVYYQSYGGGYYRANRKLSTRTGPGTDYDGKGKTLDYQKYSGEMVKVITVARDYRNDIWWAQIEIEDRGRLRRAYTGIKRFDNIDVNNLPQEGSGWAAQIVESIYPFYGPGLNYEQHRNKIYSGTYGRVILEENGYSLFEYEMNCYKHRCWVPSSTVR